MTKIPLSQFFDVDLHAAALARRKAQIEAFGERETNDDNNIPKVDDKDIHFFFEFFLYVPVFLREQGVFMKFVGRCSLEQYEENTVFDTDTIVSDDAEDSDSTPSNSDDNSNLKGPRMITASLDASQIDYRNTPLKAGLALDIRKKELRLLDLNAAYYNNLLLHVDPIYEIE